jgi:hypothetical protein
LLWFLQYLCKKLAFLLNTKLNYAKI